MEGIELVIEPDAIDAVVQKTLKRKTGARGLRSVLERALLDTMYEVPSISDLKKVVVTADVILKNAKPYLVYAQDQEQKKSA
jgi:ATP-dependent Clp protease ATP-binding subunit ClpX